MNDSTVEQEQNSLEVALAAADKLDTEALQSILNNDYPAEIAHIIESVPSTSRQFIWSVLDDETRGEVLVELRDEVRETLIETMEPAEVVAAVQELDAEDLAEILDEVPNDAVPDILDSLDMQDRARLEQALTYDEDTAGRIMDTDIITVRADVNVDVVLRYLRRHETLPPHTDSLMVVDKNNVFLGSLNLATLLTAQPEQSVGEIMNTDADRAITTTSSHDVATLIERHDLISLAIVDDDNKLMGRITIDDVVDIIQDEADQTLLSMAGLDQDDDLFAPVLISAARRAVWLGINLATAFLAAWVIGLFEATLQQVVALAVLMPVVASMGGIAGSQTLTLAIRGLALGQISSANARWLTIKEVAVGIINGIVWALVVAAIAILWFGDWRIGAIIAVAMVANLLAAPLAGIAIPLLLHRLNLDPALSGSVILTTVTDVVGFMTFLGLGSLFLL